MLALVKAVGQIELLFSILASTVLFKEKITLRELFGIFTINAKRSRSNCVILS